MKEIEEIAMNWVYKNIIGVLINFIQSLLDFMGNLINGIFVTVARANVDLPAVISARVFVTAFALALVSLMALKMHFTTYVLETDGDPDADPLNMLVRLGQAIAMICCNTWLFNLFMNFSEAFCDDLIGSAGDISVTESLGSMLAGLNILNPLNSGFVFFLTAMVIGLIAFMIIAGKRGAELSLMSILLPLFAIDLLTTNKERWNAFFTTYLVTFFSYSLQMLSFKIFCVSFTKVSVGGMTTEIAAAVGWFILMLSSPKWLEKFCYTSGLKSMASNSVRTASMSIMRPGMFRGK